ncbi:MAG: hypothetical protein KDJ24_14095 [Gammaproteobacteria bacterium]|nr:hypothetical protein [Gammaproteobacteria bacterium]
MPREKTRQFDTPRIILERRRPPMWVWLLGLTALGIWTWQTYEFGLRFAAPITVVTIDSDDSELQQRVDDLEKERDQLRFEAARHERGSQIDRQSVQNVNEQIEALRSERSELRREADRLRALVAEGDSEFTISDYSLKATGNRNEFSYAFTISRKVEGAKRVEGTVKILVRGEQQGELVELPMSKVAADHSSHHKLGFKQFQTIEGRLVTPDGFKPLETFIDIEITEPAKKALIIAYDWI